MSGLGLEHRNRLQNCQSSQRQWQGFCAPQPEGAAAPRATDDKDPAVREGSRGLVSTADLHVGALFPVRAVIDAGAARVDATRDDDVTVNVHRDTGAEQVMLSVADDALHDALLKWIPGGGERLAAGRGEKLVVSPCGPDDVVTGVLTVRTPLGPRAGRGSASDTLARLGDGGVGGVDIEIDDAGQSESIARSLPRGTTSLLATSLT